MKAKNLALTVLVLFGALSFNPLQAETRRACVRNANVEFRDCARECNADLTNELLVCAANGNATREDCYQACSATKQSCMDPYVQSRQDCHEACFDTYDAAEATCRAACVGECSSDEVYLECLDTALVNRYACDLLCRRDNLLTRDERKACQVSFKSCIASCKANT